VDTGGSRGQAPGGSGGRQPPEEMGTWGTGDPKEMRRPACRNEATYFTASRGIPPESPLWCLFKVVDRGGGGKFLSQKWLRTSPTIHPAGSESTPKSRR
jgi:hypothetical protein